jgi:Ca2+-binding EF-hand superfamily protein
MSVSGVGGQDPRQMMFSRIDTNGDGKADKSELTAFAQKLSQLTGKSISADEILAHGDQDGSGTIEAGELRPPPPPPGEGGEWSGRSSFGRGERNPFSRLDADGSGGLSSAELSAMAQRMSQMSGQVISGDTLLAQLDGDGDGQVSKTELQQGREKLHEQLSAQLQQARTRIR